MLQFNFIEKLMQNGIFCNSEISKITKTLFFHGFSQKMKIFTSSPLDGQKKKFSGMVQMVKQMSLTPFFDMPR